MTKSNKNCLQLNIYIFKEANGYANCVLEYIFFTVATVDFSHSTVVVMEGIYFNREDGRHF